MYESCNRKRRFELNIQVILLACLMPENYASMPWSFHLVCLHCQRQRWIKGVHHLIIRLALVENWKMFCISSFYRILLPSSMAKILHYRWEIHGNIGVTPCKNSTIKQNSSVVSALRTNTTTLVLFASQEVLYEFPVAISRMYYVKRKSGNLDDQPVEVEAICQRLAINSLLVAFHGLR